MHLDETKGFPGGIHPTDGYDKSLTMDVPVREYWPETVTILAEQSFRGPCSLKVRPGDHVREGQQIGEPEAFMAAPLHASVTGRNPGRYPGRRPYRYGRSRLPHFPEI